jgi:hypothetical protein
LKKDNFPAWARSRRITELVEAASGLVAQGRRVVLITHIGSVADRIKDVSYIEPDGTGGSKARWLTEEERYELGADLDLAEVGTGES